MKQGQNIAIFIGRVLVLLQKLSELSMAPKGAFFQEHIAQKCTKIQRDNEV